MYSYGYGNQGTNKIWSSKYNTMYSYGLFISAESRSSSLFEFQSITSISIVTASTSNSGATFAIYGGDTDTTPLTSKTILSPGQTLTYTPSSTMRKLSINATNGYWVDIERITINYSCQPGGVPSEKSLSSISVSGETTSFNVGDDFSFGGTVTATYSDLTQADVTSSATFSGYDMSTAGEQTVTVSYTESGTTKTTSYGITISEQVDPGVLVITGTYHYTSRSEYSTPDWSLHNMTITFYNDGTCEWRNIRTNTLGNHFDCKVYFTYVATDNGSNITLAMAHTTYDFTKDGQYNNQGGSFSGGGYDRPINGGFGVPTARNDSGVLTNNRQTLTICTYDQSHSYEVYDTFTFTLAS